MNRELPHSESAERGLLGAAFLRNSILDGIPLTDEQFYNPANRIVFAAMRKLRKAGKPVDVISVQSALPEDDLKRLGGKPNEPSPYLMEVLCCEVTADNFEHYVEIIAEKHRAKQATLTARKILDMGYDGAESDEIAAAFVDAASTMLANRPVDLASVHQLQRARIAQLLKVKESDGADKVPTGLPHIDVIYGGIPRGSHSALVAPTSHGKTSVAIHFAVHAACPVLIFVTEERDRDIIDRFIARDTGLSVVELPSAHKDLDATRKLYEAADAGSKSIYLVSARGMSDAQIAMAARRYTPRYGIRFVILDYINRIRLTAPRDLRPDERYRQAIGMFDDAAGQLDIAWLTCSQINRDAKKQNREPRLTDAREAAAMEEYSKFGMVVYRPGFDTGDDDTLFITLDKVSAGPAGSRIICDWHGPTMTLRERP